jgi:hypothetical protein
LAINSLSNKGKLKYRRAERGRKDEGLLNKTGEFDKFNRRAGIRKGIFTMCRGIVNDQ